MSRKRNKARDVSPKIVDNTDKEIRQMAMDAFSNPAAGLGWGAENLSESATYPLTRLTQNYMLMLSLYRSSGILRRIINKPVEDAVSHWIKIDSQISPEQMDALETLERRTKVKERIAEGLRWGYLFGGAAGLMMIDGQGNQLDQPLDLKTVEPDSFKGIHIVDRWSGVYPSSELVDDIADPDFGLPDYYEVREDDQSAASVTVHHSRILRFTGDELPYWEKQLEQEWGTSKVETIFDSLKRYDNVLGNIANLVWQANIWTQKTDKMEQLLGLAPNSMQANFVKSIHAQQRLMNSFGTRLVDKDDDLQNHPYSFAGLDKVFEIFQYDMSSVSGIPITILFGRSAAGLDATGDADMDNYYTMLESIQENKIRPVMEQVLPVMCMSEFGAIPDDINFSFNPVRIPTEKEKADIATAKTNSIVQAHSEGIIGDQIAMKELRSMSDSTGMFSNITDEDIENADKEPDIGDIPPETLSEQQEQPQEEAATDSKITNPIPLADNNKAIDSEIRNILLKYGIDVDTVQTNNPINIPIDSLKTTQDYVNTEKLRNLKGWNVGNTNNGNFPKVVHYKGQNYLLDGNHRTALALLRGDKTIPAWYYDIDKTANDSKPTIDEIKETAKQYTPHYKIIAVRTQEVPFELGKIKHKSERWSDGKPTGEKLDGLSATSVGSSAIRKHTPEFDPREGQYQGDYCALIGGNKFKYGHDKGEVVIRDPQVLEILRPQRKAGTGHILTRSDLRKGSENS